MLARGGAAALTLALFALAGCGGSSHPSSSASATEHEQQQALAPAAAPASVSGRVLRAGELVGFAPLGQSIVGTNPASWIGGLELSAAKKAKEIARLQGGGFRAGVRERLAPTRSGAAEAISIVEQFGSPKQAQAELAKQLGGLHVRGATTFSVPGIPGALGVAIATTQQAGTNVEFTKGDYYYVVGAGWPAHSASAPTHAQVQAAAQHLYSRVSG
jgi:hypothetical protein